MIRLIDREVYQRVVTVILTVHDGGGDRACSWFSMEDELFGTQEKQAGTISHRRFGGVEPDGAEYAVGTVGLDVGGEDVDLADGDRRGDSGGIVIESLGIGRSFHVSVPQDDDLVGQR